MPLATSVEKKVDQAFDAVCTKRRTFILKAIKINGLLHESRPEVIMST